MIKNQLAYFFCCTLSLCNSLYASEQPKTTRQTTQTDYPSENDIKKGTEIITMAEEKLQQCITYLGQYNATLEKEKNTSKKIETVSKTAQEIQATLNQITW